MPQKMFSKSIARKEKTNLEELKMTGQSALLKTSMDNSKEESRTMIEVIPNHDVQPNVEDYLNILQG